MGEGERRKGATPAAIRGSQAHRPLTARRPSWMPMTSGANTMRSAVGQGREGVCVCVCVCVRVCVHVCVHVSYVVV